jgi:hypothetical protein
MEYWKLPNGIPRGIHEEGTLPTHEKGGILLPTKPKIEGKSHVFDLQNGFFFSLMAWDGHKVFFHGVRVIKHKCDT